MHDWTDYCSFGLCICLKPLPEGNLNYKKGAMLGNYYEISYVGVDEGPDGFAPFMSTYFFFMLTKSYGKKEVYNAVMPGYEP